MKRLLCTLILGAMAALTAAGQDDPPPIPEMSVNDLMIAVITPATNTLWGVEDPRTTEDWQVFIDAADMVIDAGRKIKVGGTGPNDADWAADPAWQAFADALIDAGRDARQAALDQDIEAMFTAGEVLYPPCEECHVQFHPGVREQ